MSVVLLLSLTACGSTAPSAPAATAVPTAEPTEEPTEKGAGQPEDTGTETPAENGKTLVVYFSATGSTRREATYLQFPVAEKYRIIFDLQNVSTGTVPIDNFFMAGISGRRRPPAR